ncbi:hypothetical protein GCM10009839_90200 [Catenulispora yoronensis]|uniref:Resolvase/invertase-type recombinase catalytic domain-containing protein n=1 Tax=Catenulispora yoronensis TaxID=450799 RepID=A0ABP5H7J6_9ACTN
MRALILTRRLYPASPEDTSDAERNVCEAFVAAHGWEVVGYVDEIEIRNADGTPAGDGTADPRPALRPWLTETGRLELWDALVVTTLDRLAPSAEDGAELMAWARENGKAIVEAGAGWQTKKTSG